MAYDKYRSATEIADVDGSNDTTVTADHDALWVGENNKVTGNSGSAGDLKCTLAKDTTAVTFKGISDGTLLPIEVKSIEGTVTRCGDIVALESGERWST